MLFRLKIRELVSIFGIKNNVNSRYGEDVDFF